MTTQEQIKFIREKCIEANPSIKDLVFGCEVSWKYVHNFNHNSSAIRHKRGIFICKKYNNTAMIRFEQNRSLSEVFLEDIKIIGREIRLADVLLAFGKNKIDIGCSVSFRSDVAHMFPQGDSKKPEPIPNTNVSVDIRGAEWNLIKDSLSEQSPETIQFIFNLLK